MNETEQTVLSKKNVGL